MTYRLVVAIVAAVVVVGCADGGAPVAPLRSAMPLQLGIANAGSGTQKTAISGTIALNVVDPPTRFRQTPSEVCHLLGVLEHTTYSGDIAGEVTYVANAKLDCATTHLRSSGSFGGHVTYQGRTGDIVGHWETNCKFDEALGTLSCDGISNARGSGGLEGVQFHIAWGPGWWPFKYTGTAFVQ